MEEQVEDNKISPPDEMTDEAIAQRDAPDPDPFEDEEDILLETEFFDGEDDEADRVVE